jgi:hypothetical protein
MVQDTGQLGYLALESSCDKMMDQSNARYDDKVRDFFVALAASGNKQACEYISGNLGQSMTHRRAQRLIAGRCPSTSFISATDSEI